MAAIVIRNIDDGLKRRLRQRAAEHDRSMEEEVRTILAAALPGDDDIDVFARIRARLEPLGGFDLPEREAEPVGASIALDE